MCKTLDDDLNWLADRAGLHEPISRAAWIAAAKGIAERYRQPPATGSRSLLTEVNERVKTIEEMIRDGVPVPAPRWPGCGG